MLVAVLFGLNTPNLKKKLFTRGTELRRDLAEALAREATLRAAQNSLNARIGMTEKTFAQPVLIFR